MTNGILNTFLRDNITEILLAVIVSGLLVLILDFNIMESLSFIVLCVLVAIILNQFFRVFIPQQMKRNVYLILAIIAVFFSFQYFDIGIFSVENINSINFKTIEIEPQIQQIATPFQTLMGAFNIGKLGVIGTIVALFLFLMFFGGRMAILAGVIILAALGIILFPMVVALSNNIVLLIIFIGFFSVAKMAFGKRELKYKR